MVRYLKVIDPAGSARTILSKGTSSLRKRIHPPDNSNTEATEVRDIGGESRLD